jgi:hypothetical protein
MAFWYEAGRGADLLTTGARASRYLCSSSYSRGLSEYLRALRSIGSDGALDSADDDVESADDDMAR